jgi:integrase
MFAEGNHTNWVFCMTDGEPIKKNSFRNSSFLPILAGAGVPKIRFHDLRHTAASFLLAQGVHSKLVQEQLGHAQISITLDIYSHVSPSMQKEAAAKIDQMFKRAD